MANLVDNKWGDNDGCGVTSSASSSIHDSGCPTNDEETSFKPVGTGSILKVCRYCNKSSQNVAFQKSLMVCGRCKCKSLSCSNTMQKQVS